MTTLTPAAGQQGSGRDPFAELNDQQRAAVEHGIGDDKECGPLLVIAGAGSGKTMTLASRVARLVVAGVDPQRILMLTFSRRAAQEMERRVGRVVQQALGLKSAQRPPTLGWSGTFHGIGARLLREYANQIGLSASFTINDRSDSEDLMAMIREELGLAAKKVRFPQKGTCFAIYSRVMNSQAPLSDVLRDVYPWCAQWEAELKRLFKAYVESKQRQQVLDYDDLLAYWAQMMAVPELAMHVGARFDHVLVDEYQDTNRLQASILLALKPDGQGLTVVGDDAQSIYAFRAAEVRNILDFPKQFEPPARVVTLERNYRSTQPILEASNAVISLAAERYTKELWTDLASSERPSIVSIEDDAAQARWIADRVLERRESGVPLNEQSVLFRAASHSAALEMELMRRDIPFVKFGGLKFFETAHVKDVLAVLRWVENPRDQLAAFRVAQLLPGMGPANARRLLQEMQAAADPVHAIHTFKAPSAADWSALVDAYDEIGASAWPGQIELANRWYAPHLHRIRDDAGVREHDLEQLVRIAAGYASRERFLTELSLDPPEAAGQEPGTPDDECLVLATIHAAKGREWRAVYVLNVVDGCIPSSLSIGTSAEIEEERRLLYVAMTRAKQHLHLIVPQRLYTGVGSDFYSSLSTFIPPKVADCFEHVADGALEREDQTQASARDGVAVDLRSRIRSVWD